MTNGFLKVDKSLLGNGLNPIEILVYAQVAEYNRTTGDCFMSDKAFAEAFGVSDKTVSRALTSLESKGMIRRETKNVKGGKERHIYIVDSTTDKKSVDSSQQPTKCPLTTDNLSIDNRQNDLIKENIKEKRKDNIVEMKHPADVVISPMAAQAGKKPEEQFVF